VPRLISIARLNLRQGLFLLADSGAGLCRVSYGSRKGVPAGILLDQALSARFGRIEIVEDSAPLEPALDYLRNYFLNPGGMPPYDGAIDPGGTPFQRSVWDCLRRIPAGRTLTYGEVARETGRPKAARAVGAACGANPLLIVVPCHRVIGCGGDLTGFGAGLALKERLLRAEGWEPEKP
jgi:methylated-DNA-[protein]-cysteine S-methyltransferase